MRLPVISFELQTCIHSRTAGGSNGSSCISGMEVPSGSAESPKASTVRKKNNSMVAMEIWNPFAHTVFTGYGGMQIWIAATIYDNGGSKIPVATE